MIAGEVIKAKRLAGAVISKEKAEAIADLLAFVPATIKERTKATLHQAKQGQRYCTNATFRVEPSTKAKEAEQQAGSDESSQSQVIPVEQNETHVTKTFDFKIVIVNAKGEIIQRESKQAQCEIEDLGNGVTLEMVSIPSGTFVMGSPETEKEREPWKKGTQSPQYRVTIQPFWMAKYPMTQRQWQAVMGNNPALFKGENRPVEKISWHEVVEFYQRLSEKIGKTYRLPSEAEWEYACRAGTTTPFYFGETITTDLVNYNGKYPYASAPKGIYREETTEVGTFPPNAFGLYDMHGNVWEWCADPWHDNYNGAPIDGSVWQKGGSGLFVLRGGSATPGGAGGCPRQDRADSPQRQPRRSACQAITFGVWGLEPW